MRGFRLSALVIVVCALLAAPFALAQSAHPLADAAKQRIQRELQARRAQQTPATTTPAPTAQQPVSLVVPANQEWYPTRVNVESGGRLQINAGRGTWTPLGQRFTAAAAANNATTDADGFPDRRSAQSIVPGANIGALIGKIGANGAPFLIGSNYDATASAGGLLYLAINDQAGGFVDNSGRMPVSVLAAAAPPPTQPPQPPQQQPQPNDQPAPGVPATTTQAPTGTTTALPPDTTTAATTTDVPVTPTDTPADTPGATTSATPAEPAAPASLPPWAIPVGVGALLIGAILLWPKPKRPPPRNTGKKSAPRSGVTARIVSDGRAGQNLHVTWKDHK